MKRDLLLELLGLFERKDFVHLSALAQSNLWVINDKDQQFLNKLAENPHRYEQIYEKEKANNSNGFNQRKRNIVKLIEDYILLLENRKSKHEANRSLQLLNFYNQERLINNYKKQLKKVEKGIDNRPLDKDTSLLLFRYYEVKATNARIHRQSMDELEKMNTHLLSFFVENNLRLVSEAKTQKEIINSKYKVNNFFKFLPFKVNTLIKDIYDNIYQLWTAPNPQANYDFLKYTIQNKASIISQELLKTTHTHLMNYSIKQMNRGNHKYASEYLFYIKSLVGKNLFLERNRLDYGRYRNTIISYLIESPTNFMQVDEFIDVYKGVLDLPAKMEKAIININSLYVASFKKEYEKSHQELLALTDQNLDLHHKIMFKKLDLRLMVMLSNQTETLERKVINFKLFLNRQNQLGAKKLKVTIGFAECLHKMALNNLTLKEIQETELALTDKIWFLTKILERSQPPQNRF